MVSDIHIRTQNTPLVIFIFCLYILFMCLVKRIIKPIQHLFIVVGIICLMVCITYMEHIIISYTEYVDKWVFNKHIVEIIHNVLDRVILIIGNDYKRSNLRRLVKRTKTYVNYFLK